MKEFNLEEAKAGKPVCTRNGRPVRIICFNLKTKLYPIAAAVEYDGYGEQVAAYTLDGRFTDGGKSEQDLMMATTKHEGWINIYKTHYFGNEKHRYEGNIIYDTREEAEKALYRPSFVTTTKIEWEE